MKDGMTKLKQIETNTISVHELLSDRLFRIPDYQRPFKWETSNFEALISDLVNADKAEQYFLGTLVLHKNDDVHDVVDGQQRLTTLMILYSCFIRHIKDQGFLDNFQELILQKAKPLANISARVRLESKNSSSLSKIINGEIPTSDDLVTTRMLKAKKVFDEKLQDLSEDELKDLSIFITSKCVLVVIFAETFQNAFKLFSVVNSRGMRLRPVDVIKANNMSLDNLTSTTRTRMSKSWEKLEEDLGEDAFEELISIIRFIHKKSKQHSDMITEYEDLFSDKSIGRGESFLNEVEKYGILYKNILIENRYSDNNFANNLLSIMTSKLSGLQWKACLLEFANVHGKNGFDDFCIKIEKLSLCIWMSGIRDKKWSMYADVLKDLKRKDDFDILFKESYFSSDDFCSKLNSIYGKPYGQYLLMRYELLSADNDFSKSLYIKSIEHVLPQNPTDDSDWCKNFTDSERSKWLNNIANLIPLNQSKNSSLGNLDFNDKKDRYLTKKMSDFITTNDVMNSDDWTPETLQARFEKIKGVMAQ